MEDEIRRYIEVLEFLVERSGLSRREVERRLDWGGGLLSKILSRNKSLKVSQILDVLRTIGVDPVLFYRLAHSPEPVSEGLLDGLTTRANEPIAPPMTAADLERRLEEAVRRALRPLDAPES